MKDPAVLLYTNDFLSGTYTMTDDQVGKYIKLLCLQHQKGRLTEKDMLSVCKTYDEDIYCKFKRDGDTYYNERMAVEAEKRSKYSESRRNNRKDKPKTNNKEDMNNISKRYVQHMENEDGIENENEDQKICTGEKKLFPEQPVILNGHTAEYFVKWWKFYNRREGDVEEIKLKFASVIRTEDEYKALIKATRHYNELTANRKLEFVKLPFNFLEKYKDFLKIDN